MYSVSVTKECGCFKKSNFTNNREFDTQEEAKAYAAEIVKVADNEFCAKHTFKVIEDVLGYKVIVSEARY